MKRRAMLPPAYLLIAILAMVALHFLLPVRKVIPWPYRCFGGLLVTAGVLLNIWSDYLFKKAKTTVRPFEESSRLITEGPYRFSRHPMYLGMAMGLAGLAVLLGSVTPVLVIPAFVWAVTRKFLRVEEKAMAETFGDAYRQYKKRVRRWI